MSVLLRVAYDGTDFHGYAGQHSGPDGTPIRTVQGDLEAALKSLYKVNVMTRASSRTDAGVHAYGQLVAFRPERDIPMPGLVRGLNTALAKDIRVLAAWEESDDLDVRRDNEGKYYRYRLRSTEVSDPLTTRYEWHVARRLDPYAMQEAATLFKGTHDFGSFRAAACQAETTTRTVDAVEVTFGAAAVGPMGDRGRLDTGVKRGEQGLGPASAWGPDWVEFHVWGHAFLMHMVRIMVGTLVDVGIGRRQPEDITHLLAIQDRTRAGMTAPSHGLTLVEVKWPKDER